MHESSLALLQNAPCTNTKTHAILCSDCPRCFIHMYKFTALIGINAVSDEPVNIFISLFVHHKLIF